MILYFLSLTFLAVTIEGQYNNSTSYCGGCYAGGSENEGIFYTIPLADTTYTLDCITEYISTNEAGVATETITNSAILSSFDDFIASKFVPSLGSRALTVPVSIFPSYGTATVDVNPLYYSTITTMAGATSCVGVSATPLGTVSPLRLYPKDSAAQEAATTSLLEMAYFSPLPTSCSIEFAGEPYYQIPVRWLTSTIDFPPYQTSDNEQSSYYFQSPITSQSMSTESTHPFYIQTPQTSTTPSPSTTPPSSIPGSATNELQRSLPTSDLLSIPTPLPDKTVGSPAESGIDSASTQTPILPASVTFGSSIPQNSILPASITFGSSVISINSESAYIISSQTLTAGGVITIDSTTISLATDGSQVVINSKTETISQPSSDVGIGVGIISAVNGPQATLSRIAAGSQITTAVNGPQSTSGSIAAGSGNSIRLAYQHFALAAMGVLASVVCT